MDNVLTSVDISKIDRIMSIYWNLPPEEQKKFDDYEKEQDNRCVVDCMEEYFRNNGMI